MKPYRLCLFLILFFCELSCSKQDESPGRMASAAPSDSALIAMFDKGLISRDSLIAMLSAQGRLTPSQTTESSSADFQRDAHSGSPSIEDIKEQKAEMRKRLTFTFAFDFVVSRLDSSDLYFINWREIATLETSDVMALETFVLDFEYRLYKMPDFQGVTEYYLLAHFYSGFIGFDLFAADSLHRFINTLKLPREGTFRFQTLNGGNVIRIEYPTWGTGYRANHLQLVSIDRGDINVMFGEYLSFEAGYPWSVPSSQRVNDLKFIDLNQDGMLDISLESTLRTCKDSTGLYWNPMIPHETTQEAPRRFVWSNESRRFEEQFWNQL